jgi:hypothetical protein
MNGRGKKLIGGALLVACFFLVAVLYGITRPPPATIPLPNPNGHDALVAAAAQLVGKVSEYRDLSVDDLKSLVEKNADAMKLARTGLSHECRVQLYSQAEFQNHIQEITDLRNLALAFTAAGRLAETNNSLADAADAYLQAARIGQESGKGGIMIHSMVGIAIEAIGIVNLERLAPALDARTCAKIAKELYAGDEKTEPYGQTLKQEREWTRRVYGVRGQIAYLFSFKSMRQMNKKWTLKVQTQRKRTRSLILQLARRAYELDKGEQPKSLQALVPEYLPSIPLDPFTGAAMAYP